MKILFDVSSIGLIHRHLSHTSGLHRVIETAAASLAKAQIPDLKFCTLSTESFYGYTLYRDLHPDLQKVSLSGEHSALLNAAANSYAQLDQSNRAIENAHTRFANKSGLAVLGSRALAARFKRRALMPLISAADNLMPLQSQDLAAAQIYHSPYEPIPPLIRTAKKLQNFVTVYDLIPLLRPQYCTEAQKEWTNRLLASVRPDDWLCAISQATKDDFCNHTQIAPENVFVTHLAASPEVFYPCQDASERAQVRRRYGIPEGPYALSLCTLEPRKNLNHAIRSFSRLVRENQTPDLSLVLAGGKGWLYEEIFAAISGSASEQAAIKERIIVTGYVQDEELAALYSDALVFLYPSLHEGFGLPPLEAMQCGLPVIASNTTSLPEVVGDAGILLDPHDEDGLCQAILNFYQQPQWRAEIAQRALKRATHFSWERFVAQTLAAYQTAL